MVKLCSESMIMSGYSGYNVYKAQQCGYSGYQGQTLFWGYDMGHYSGYKAQNFDYSGYKGQTLFWERMLWWLQWLHGSNYVMCP